MIITIITHDNNINKFIATYKNNYFGWYLSMKFVDGVIPSSLDHSIRESQKQSQQQTSWWHIDNFSTMNPENNKSNKHVQKLVPEFEKLI